MAIPEIDGRDADRLTSFAYLTPTAGPESEAPPARERIIMTDELDKGPDGELLDFIEDIADALSDWMDPNRDSSDCDYGD